MGALQTSWPFSLIFTGIQSHIAFSAATRSYTERLNGFHWLSHCWRLLFPEIFIYCDSPGLTFPFFLFAAHCPSYRWRHEGQRGSVAFLPKSEQLFLETILKPRVDGVHITEPGMLPRWQHLKSLGGVCSLHNHDMLMAQLLNCKSICDTYFLKQHSVCLLTVMLTVTLTKIPPHAQLQDPGLQTGVCGAVNLHPCYTESWLWNQTWRLFRGCSESVILSWIALSTQLLGFIFGGLNYSASFCVLYLFAFIF